jgi:hypothetical protein
MCNWHVGPITNRHVDRLTPTPCQPGSTALPTWLHRPANLAPTPCQAHRPGPSTQPGRTDLILWPTYLLGSPANWHPDPTDLTRRPQRAGIWQGGPTNLAYKAAKYSVDWGIRTRDLHFERPTGYHPGRLCLVIENPCSPILICCSQRFLGLGRMGQGLGLC